MPSKDSIAIKDKNHMLNLLKGIACIGVVFIHFHFPEPTGTIIAKLCQFAVPLFFMIAGFYAFNKDKLTIKRRLVKIFDILIVSLVIYTFYWFISHCITHDVTKWIMNELTLRSFAKFLLFCTVDYAIPLWYLIAMLQTYIFWYFAFDCKKENLFLKSLPILFILQFLLTSYVETNNLSWSLKINFITRALPWFLAGFYINKYKNTITKINNTILCLPSILGIFIVISHIISKTDIDFSCVGIPFYAIPIFIIGIKYSHVRLSNWLVYIGEKLSLNIYILL